MRLRPPTSLHTSTDAGVPSCRKTKEIGGSRRARKVMLARLVLRSSSRRKQESPIHPADPFGQNPEEYLKLIRNI